MSAPTVCTCTLTVKDFLGASAGTLVELVAEPRQAFMENSNLILSRPQRAVAVAGVCTLALVETASTGQTVTFTLNYDDGQYQKQIVFNPVTIPSQASLDLSTRLTVQRG